MKKAFISIALAAALFCGANAQTTANIPTWYSYQGVSDVHNKDIKVVFYIVTGDDMTPVYAESHNVTTNAAGAFSCQLGLGALESVNNYDTLESITDVDWAAGNYKVQTWIDGKLVGTADLGAVPYATIAGKAYGIAGVDGNLNEIIEELYIRDEKNDENLTFAINAQAAVDAEQNANIEGAFTYIEEQLGNLNPLWGMVADLDEKVEGLETSMDYVTSDLQELIPAVHENTVGRGLIEAKVNEIDDDMASVTSDLQELIPAVHENTVGRGLLTAKLDELEAKVNALGGAADVDLTEVNAAIAALRTDVDINIEGIANAEQTLVEIVPAVQGNTAAIAALRADVDINIEGIANAEQTLVEIVPAVQGNTAAIARLQEDVETIYEGLATTQDDVINVTEQARENKAAIAQLNQYAEGFNEQLESIATLATGASNIAIANEEAIEALKDQMVYATEQADNANLAITQLNNVVNDLAANIDASHVELWKEINQLNNLITTLGEAVADINARVNGALGH
ncbi:MAG: hypothetical protein K2K05_03015 [Muribaculaceae bacterium]|nr:hypothetical protein [Muribaculaceae bacterium]